MSNGELRRCARCGQIRDAYERNWFVYSRYNGVGATGRGVPLYLCSWDCLLEQMTYDVAADAERNSRASSRPGRDSHGPWEHEQDEYEWIDEDTSLKCVVLRHPQMGHLSYYVVLPDGHPWADIEDEYDLDDAVVDGCHGIVYLGYLPDHNDDAEWPTETTLKCIGFACATLDDILPYDSTRHIQYPTGPFRSVMWGLSIPHSDSGIDPTYKDIAFVRAECKELCFAVKEAQQSGGNAS